MTHGEAPEPARRVAMLHEADCSLTQTPPTTLDATELVVSVWGSEPIREATLANHGPAGRIEVVGVTVKLDGRGKAALTGLRADGANLQQDEAKLGDDISFGGEGSEPDVVGVVIDYTEEELGPTYPGDIHGTEDIRAKSRERLNNAGRSARDASVSQLAHDAGLAVWHGSIRSSRNTNDGLRAKQGLHAVPARVAEAKVQAMGIMRRLRRALVGKARRWRGCTRRLGVATGEKGQVIDHGEDKGAVRVRGGGRPSSRIREADAVLAT